MEAIRSNIVLLRHRELNRHVSFLAMCLQKRKMSTYLYNTAVPLLPFQEANVTKWVICQNNVETTHSIVSCHHIISHLWRSENRRTEQFRPVGLPYYRDKGPWGVAITPGRGRQRRRRGPRRRPSGTPVRDRSEA